MTKYQQHFKSCTYVSKLQIRVTQHVQQIATKFRLLYPCFWAIAINTAEPWRPACDETSFIGSLNPKNMATTIGIPLLSIVQAELSTGTGFIIL